MCMPSGFTWRRKWQPTPVFLTRESCGHRSLVGCHLWGHTESDTTEATQRECMHAFRRKWQPTPVFLPGESQGQRSLVCCHLWGHTELDMTEATQQQQQDSPLGMKYAESVSVPSLADTPTCYIWPSDSLHNLFYLFLESLEETASGLLSKSSQPPFLKWTLVIITAVEGLGFLKHLEVAIANTSCSGGLLLHSVMLIQLRFASAIFPSLFNELPAYFPQLHQVRSEWKSNGLLNQRQNYCEIFESTVSALRGCTNSALFFLKKIPRSMLWTRLFSPLPKSCIEALPSNMTAFRYRAFWR